MIIEVAVGRRMEYFFISPDEDMNAIEKKLSEAKNSDFFYNCLQSRILIPVAELIEQSHHFVLE